MGESVVSARAIAFGFSCGFFAYGIVGLIAGAYGFGAPCNRYASADITWCGPAVDLGVFYFNLSYSDVFDQSHNGSIVSSTIACTTGSTQQHVRVCYPLKDPGAFRNDTVVFASPVVAPLLTFTAMLPCPSTRVR